MYVYICMLCIYKPTRAQLSENNMGRYLNENPRPVLPGQILDYPPSLFLLFESLGLGPWRLLSLGRLGLAEEIAVDQELGKEGKVRRVHHGAAQGQGFACELACVERASIRTVKHTT